jgi:Transposase DDE domain group 1
MAFAARLKNLAEESGTARRVIVKAEHNAQGANPRLLVTSLANAPQERYERGYCARGGMENRIKERQPGLFADRTSCHLWWPNQFRLLLASLAHVLMERLRAIGLAGTEVARASGLDAALPLAQARRAHPQEHPPHPFLPRQRLPPPGGLCPCRPPFRLRIACTECSPATMTLRGSWGGTPGVRQIAQNLSNSPVESGATAHSMTYAYCRSTA